MSFWDFAAFQRRFPSDQHVLAYVAELSQTLDVSESTHFAAFYTSPLNILTIIFLFVLDLQATDVVKLVSPVSYKVVRRVYALLRAICSQHLEEFPIQFDQLPHCTCVEIDESFFGRRQKYRRLDSLLNFNQSYCSHSHILLHIRDEILLSTCPFRREHNGLLESQPSTPPVWVLFHNVYR